MDKNPDWAITVHIKNCSLENILALIEDTTAIGKVVAERIDTVFVEDTGEEEQDELQTEFFGVEIGTFVPAPPHENISAWRDVPVLNADYRKAEAKLADISPFLIIPLSDPVEMAFLNAVTDGTHFIERELLTEEVQPPDSSPPREWDEAVARGIRLTTIRGLFLAGYLTEDEALDTLNGPLGPNTVICDDRNQLCQSEEELTIWINNLFAKAVEKENNG